MHVVPATLLEACRPGMADPDLGVCKRNLGIVKMSRIIGLRPQEEPRIISDLKEEHKITLITVSHCGVIDLK